jgi:hypothetical protein
VLEVGLRNDRRAQDGKMSPLSQRGGASVVPFPGSPSLLSYGLVASRVPRTTDAGGCDLGRRRYSERQGPAAGVRVYAPSGGKAVRGMCAAFHRLFR